MSIEYTGTDKKGTSEDMATCHGAAFEYALNIAFELKKQKLSHLAEITLIHKTDPHQYICSAF